MFKKVLNIGVILAFVASLYLNSVIPEVFAAGQGNCEPGYVLKDEQSPFTYSGTSIITRVIVKAGSAQSTDGNQCIALTVNGSNGCYSVSGLGTGSVTVVKVGQGPSCKDISHVEFYGDNQATPTPTVSAPTVTPTAKPTSAPTSTPSVVPTATPTSVPTPTTGDNPTPTTTPNDPGDPTATPIATPTTGSTPNPTATPVPDNNSNSSSSNNNSNSNSGSSSSQGQVLGAATEYTGTGVIEDVIASFAGLLGVVLTGTGLCVKGSAKRLS